MARLRARDHASLPCDRDAYVKLWNLITAVIIGLAVTVSVLTDTWLWLLAGVCGVVFVIFAIAHPKTALLVWLLAAPAGNTYATLDLPGGIPDLTFGRVAVGIVSVALLLRVILKGRPLKPFGALELGMIVLIGAMTADLMRSANPSSDFMQALDGPITPVLFFLAARNFCGRRVDLKQAVAILVLVGCYLALHGGYQFAMYGRPNPTGEDVSLDVRDGGQRVNESHLGEGRAVGPFGSAVEYGSVAGIAFLGALFLVLYQRRSLLRAASVAALPLIGAAVVMSSTRSAWLGAYLATVLMAALDRRRKILLAGIAAATVAGVVGATFVLPSSSSLEERASSLEPIRARLVMWELGLRIAVRRPVTGYGHGAPSRIAARKELVAIGSRDAEFAAGQFHNTFLMALVETGIVGLAAYIAILVLIVRAAIQLRRRLADERDPAYHFAGLVLATTLVFVTQMMFIDTPPMLYLNGLCFLFAGLMFAQIDATAPDGKAYRLRATETTGGLTWGTTNSLRAS
jgi:hypothetical protein